MTVETNVATGEDGKIAFRVTTFVHFRSGMPEVRSSPEMAPAVHDIDRALAELPMGRGTKRVLRLVRARGQDVVHRVADHEHLMRRGREPLGGMEER